MDKKIDEARLTVGRYECILCPGQSLRLQNYWGKEALLVLYAKDIVETDFITLAGETTALDAAKIMAEKKHGYALVSTNGTVTGIVTEWDYLSKVVANEKNPAAVSLRDIMSQNLFTVLGTDGIDLISKIMSEKGIRRVVVMEKDKIIGVITSKTILRRLDDYVNRVSSQIARLQSPF